MTQLITMKGSFYCCNCGELFNNREALAVHIQNKKKGKNKDIHYGGDYTTGNKTGLIKFVHKIK